MSGIGEFDGTGGADNNSEDKNIYTKADFSTYNIVNANTGTGIGDAIVTDEEIGSNTNNTSVGQSGRMSGANKDRVDGANKGKVGGGNESRVDWANKGKAGRTDKGGTGGANIKVGKKAGAGAIASTNNNADSSGKVID